MKYLIINILLIRMFDVLSEKIPFHRHFKSTFVLGCTWRVLKKFEIFSISYYLSFFPLALWNELIMCALLNIHYSASYCSLLAFVTRYTSTQAFHNWNRRVVARVAQWCANLNWVNGKLHTKINTVQKQLTCLAPFASALPFLLHLSP